MFHKNYKIVLLFLIVSFIFSCKVSKNETSKEIGVEKIENALLWKIEGKELKQPSYLFGTIHLIKAESYFLSHGFNDAFESSKNIVFEIDMKEMNDPAKMMDILPKIMMRGDTSLKDLLTDEEYNIVGEHLKKSGLPIFLFEKIKPLFLTMLGDSDFNAMSLQNGDYKSYEMEFSEMAENKGKKIHGLETIDYQVSILDAIPYKEQADMLMKSLSSQNEDSSELDQMVELYKQQNINALHNTIQSDDISKYEDIILNNRNNNWIPLMSNFMNQDVTFFAVGAGHLGGKDGVINLLRKNGYKLTPIKK